MQQVLPIALLIKPFKRLLLSWFCNRKIWFSSWIVTRRWVQCPYEWEVEFCDDIRTWCVLLGSLSHIIATESWVCAMSKLTGHQSDWEFKIPAALYLLFGCQTPFQLCHTPLYSCIRSTNISILSSDEMCLPLHSLLFLKLSRPQEILLDEHHILIL